MTARREPARRWLLLPALLALAPAAVAHTRGASYSEWTLDAGGAQVAVRASQLELTRLALDPWVTPDYAAQAGAALARDLTLRAGAEPCVPGPVQAQAGADGWVHARWSVHCDVARPGAAPRAIESRLLHAVAPSHLHFARAAMPDGSVREAVLTAASPALELPAGGGDGTLVRYVELGVGHILSGWDHLAFVVALLLVAGGLAEMALVVTGFTLAHSLTLAAAVLGLAVTDAPRVEAVIGFTIALVAIEGAWARAGKRRWMPLALLAVLALAAWRLPPLLVLGLGLLTACYFALQRGAPRPARLRVALALVFGLVHGFGFAGALLELRLPPAQLATGLLGFNLGVELGQLLVIAAAWPLLRLLSRRPALQAWALDGAAAGLAGVGVYWFLLRSFG